MPWFRKKKGKIEPVRDSERVVRTENVFVRCEECGEHLYKKELEDALQVFFFFKQKTAYEIGLGIPAEPLFRSCVYYGKHQSFQATAGFRDYAPNAYSSSNGWSVFYQ